MRIQAEISLYPLRTMELSPTINRFRKVLEKKGVRVVDGPMSTIIGGAKEDVFRVLEEAFGVVSEDSEVVLTCKISNACPEAPGGICEL
ncbi:MAG: hypothetical protein GX751_10295 [Desulfuromonadaceae bacterium]|nr:hypothetical protein [Desulfuromonadaceae bacterium]